MQTKKILTGLMVLLFGGCLQAQQSITNNNTQTFKKENSFLVTVSADTDPAVFVLSIQNPEGKKLQLEIRNRELGTVIDTTINGLHYTRRYNLTQVDDGKYAIIVSIGKEKITKELELNTVTSRNLVIH